MRTQSYDVEVIDRLYATNAALVEAAEAAMLWAKTPGDHGGNPYCKDFVRKAGAALKLAKGEG